MITQEYGFYLKTIQFQIKINKSQKELLKNDN